MAIVRKIILRIKSWENYVFFLSGYERRPLIRQPWSPIPAKSHS